MAGTIIGMFATANGKESDNVAEFDWFQMKEAK
jgi:alpha-N-arabinofuranosidase